MKSTFYFTLFTTVLMALGCQLMAQVVTFHYTGAVQTYTVPACVTSILVDAQGAQGGHGKASRGGGGGRVQCTLAVTPGAVLNIYVGGYGDTGVVSSPTSGGAGGYNGGAAGGALSGSYAGGGGGGASDIRVTPYALGNRIVVAGGGGGAGFDYNTPDYDKGGNGGGTTAQGGSHNNSMVDPKAGGAGTPSAGGIGGVFANYVSGLAGIAGSGGAAGNDGAGGGGGGGWYGGGGGAWGGGGGGSSYTDAGLATLVTHTQGFDTLGDGKVVITPVCAPPGTILGNSYEVCVGATIPLNNPSSVPCGTWMSSTPAVATIGASTGIVTGVSGGTTVITYNLSNPCGGTSATKTITVNPVPAVVTGANNVCVGAQTTLADASGFGGWLSSDTMIAKVGVGTGVVSGIAAGNATIRYALSTGCAATLAFTVNTCAGINDLDNDASVSIFPVPVKDELTIRIEAGTYNSFVLANNMGQIVMQQTLAATETKLALHNLPPSTYTLILKGEKGNAVKRFVKVE